MVKLKFSGKDLATTQWLWVGLDYHPVVMVMVMVEATGQVD